MYANYFGFRDIPFRKPVDPQHVYLSHGFAGVRSEVLDVIREGAKLILITGHPGTGKTQMLLHLQATLEGTAPVYYLPYAALNVEEFVQHVASAMQIGLPSGDDSDIFEAFWDGLRDLARGSQKPILLVDDADSLGRDVLENLIELFQLAPEDETLAQIVLAARPELEHTLQRPELSSLEEHLAGVCRVRPLSAEEIEPYIEFCLRSIEYDGDPVFTAGAIRAIAVHSRGIPQLVNNLCGASLMVAFGRDERSVDEALVELAMEDVLGFAAREEEEDLAESADGDIDWFDIDYRPGSALEAEEGSGWRELARRRWPVAALGIGGSLAAASLLMLSLPSGSAPMAVNQNQASSPSLVAQRLTDLSAEVRSVRMERDRLQGELAGTIDERDELARALAIAEDLKARADERLRETGDEAPADELSIDDVSVDMDPMALLASLGEPEEAVEVSIESPDSAPTRSATSPASVYVVKRGDTMWRIAQMHGITLEALMAVNGLTDPNQVRAGQTLKVSASPTADAAAGDTLPSASGWYVVQAGDSLYGIGQRFESSVTDLLRWNDLADAGQLQVGQRLRLSD